MPEQLKLQSRFVLPHKGETLEEQIDKNQAALALLKQWIEEEPSPEEVRDREQYWQTVKEIIDRESKSGFKLYHQE
ncbi:MULTISPECIES: hypothetical protein [unclassified Roseofilum]|uniref:hypothetical protein n=1 Tax=unclassified Roseofilum TaxID=2620099 RepID=UPI000E8F5C1E|nr:MULTISPECIES: hypothetical protein [unclassified Roseofilum]MBP0008416.1 hypothetical protein [Roseofilum sp. Belize Diploria]MBP0033314.1 hypothetical protein [Roseofilum sp. Belize BBD 4]MBP0040187.1 hypothetical protein [Roseofilum sp. SID1]HBR00438.1 hypothetical protein [Cyanobacteria bacterium UBA11691]